MLVISVVFASGAFFAPIFSSNGSPSRVVAAFGSGSFESEALFNSIFSSDGSWSGTVFSDMLKSNAFSCVTAESDALGPVMFEYGMVDSETSGFEVLLDPIFSSVEEGVSSVTFDSGAFESDTLGSVTVEYSTLDSEAIGPEAPFDSIFSIVGETVVFAVTFDSKASGSEVSLDAIFPKDGGC